MSTIDPTKMDADLLREIAKNVEAATPGFPPEYQGKLRTWARRLNALLPTPTPRTMSEVEWEEAVHAGLCAESTDDGVVRMIGLDWVNDHADHILCYLRPGAFDSLPMHSLTPLPGTRVDLTPTSEPVTSEPSMDEPATINDGNNDAPHPEDVSDPQPGEAWLVNYKGTHYEALYWYSPIYAHWALAPNREGLTTIESHEATPMHRLVPEVKA